MWKLIQMGGFLWKLEVSGERRRLYSIGSFFKFIIRIDLKIAQKSDNIGTTIIRL